MFSLASYGAYFIDCAVLAAPLLSLDGGLKRAAGCSLYPGGYLHERAGGAGQERKGPDQRPGAERDAGSPEIMPPAR